MLEFDKLHHATKRAVLKYGIDVSEFETKDELSKYIKRMVIKAYIKRFPEKHRAIMKRQYYKKKATGYRKHTDEKYAKLQQNV
jgi:hypothetical protein